MSNNVTLDPGSGGATIRAIDKAGVETPVTLIDIGGTGAESLVSASNPMPVSGNVGITGNVSIAGNVNATQAGNWAVTANAGNNLNTSALSLEATQLTIAGIVTAARAAVNPIAGQAGVQGNNGVVTALTQRVCLATDVPLPSGSNVIGGVNQNGTWTVQSVQSGNWNVGVSGNVGITGSVVVTATDLDIRDLNSATDSVSAVQSGTWNIATVTNVGTVGAVTAITNALPAGSNVIGGVTQSGNWTVLQGAAPWSQNITQLAGNAINVGAGNAGTGTARVVIASDQVAIPAAQSGTWNITTVTAVSDAQVQGKAADGAALSGNPVRMGARASNAAPTPVADGNVVTPWCDLNGRRIVVSKSANGTTTVVPGNNATTTLLAANNARTGATIYNESTAILFLKLGSGGNLASFTLPIAGNSGNGGGYYETPFGYTGIITGIWASANGNAYVTELN